MENVSFTSSLEGFLYALKNIKSLDFPSQPIKDFSMFNRMINLTWLRLSRVNFIRIDQITFDTLKLLKHLDLSYNKLKSLTFKSFYQNLEHLDLSFNSIEYVETTLFANYIFNAKASLTYLNLENNQIISFENIFTNYINLNMFKIGHNRLTTIPEFNMHWSGQYEIRIIFLF
jgi:Leucine-rich repeat (LRR) protein